MAEFESCDKCKHNMKMPNEEPCCGCIHNAVDKFEPKTNADRIREMSDEELAELLIRQHACDKCDYFGGGARCKAPGGFVCTNGYAEALMLQWLKSEAKE